jgi:transcriptional regulator with XRE-family HTH domain
MNALYHQLRQKRLERGMQQKEVAYQLNLSNAAYSKIESGKTNVSLALAKRIADILEVPISELIEHHLPVAEKENDSSITYNSSYSVINLQSEKLFQNQHKLFEQLINLLISQNETFKEFTRIIKNL